ncbi:MAG: hypothetical protein U5L96_11835 [Owenweeksia sp.]|nr:hypothetical protein [Owenweeksia sp.]
MLDFDFFEILELPYHCPIPKHIATYYDTAAIGKFPERNKPLSVQSPLTETGEVSYVRYIAEHLTLLNLSIYTPLNYILSSKVQLYADIADREVRSGSGKLSQVDRDNSLRILMRINLLKRLESSAGLLQDYRIGGYHLFELKMPSKPSNAVKVPSTMASRTG